MPSTLPEVAGNVTKFPFFQRASPIMVPIHKLPSLAARRDLTREEGRRFPSVGVQRTNRTPSNRISPDCVPIQRYPSVVCAIALGEPLKTPSCMRQAVWAYWEIHLVGSSAERVPTADRSRKISGSGFGMCIAEFRFQASCVVRQ